MDSDIPRPEDHLGLLIYVKLCNASSPNPSQVLFNRIYERLRRIGSISVSDNPPRSVVPNFVVSLTDSKTGWGDFQQHRKIIGLICVGFEGDCHANGCCEESNGEECEKTIDSPDSSKTAFSSIFEQYQTVKDVHRSTLVDARCIVVGTPSIDNVAATSQSSSSNLEGLLRYVSLEDASELEHDIRDYVKALYWVLEGKRLDLSFEKLDTPPCPVAPDEDKFLVGLDRTSRAFRKRCIGRLRKQVADVTLMTGLPTLALESYNAAIDQLKSANDWLWLAGAYEGFACAALVAKYGKPALESLTSPTSSTSTSLPRVPTFTPGDMKRAQQRQSSPSGGATMARRSAGSNLRPDSPRQNTVKLLINENEIEEKFRLAIENYQKFTFAAPIECECAFKATALYLLDRRYDGLDEFVNVHCARFLDENFKVFTDVQKGQICNLIATIYKTIGFRRKMAFFTRLSALFRLYLSRDDPVSMNDYRQVYPLFLTSLDGYRIPWGGLSGPVTTSGGWPAVQVRALHETYVSALRANHRDAAARHLAHMIQVALESSSHPSNDELLSQFGTELAQLNSQFGTHNISTHLRLSNGAILPPVQLTKLPKLLSADLKPLPAHLSPCDVPDSVTKAIFIYSPFQTGFQNTQTRWVVGCKGTVSIKLQNLLPLKLEVKNLVLVGEGVSFEPLPELLVLPPKSSSIAVDLCVTPMEAGTLTLTGCSCEVLGLKSVCRFDDIPWLKRSRRTICVEVLASLPVVELSTSMRRAENPNPSELTETCSAEITLYAGQKQTEVVHLSNSSDLDIERIEWEVQQPSVFGVTPLIAVQEAVGEFELPFSARTVRDIRLCVRAVDPLTIEGEVDENKKKMTSQEAISSIPYTGRVLTATIKFLYCGIIRNGDMVMDSPGKLYQRCCALTIFVTILPMVVVIDWHVLPGETSNDRYIALDVVNAADYEVDIQFPVDKTVIIQPKDVCRVPMLCECCDLSSVTSSQLLRGPRARHYMMDARRKFVQEHVMNRLKVGWALTSNRDVCGDVPIGALLTSTRLCKELVMSYLTCEVTLCGASGGANNEYVTGVGERVTLTAKIVQAKKRGNAVANLRLQFFQDYQNGLTNPVADDVLHIGSGMHLVHLTGDSTTFSRDFQFLFCNEGNYKVSVSCDVTNSGEIDMDIDDDLLFGSPIMPVLSVNVVSRCEVDVP